MLTWIVTLLAALIAAVGLVLWPAEVMTDDDGSVRVIDIRKMV